MIKKFGEWSRGGPQGNTKPVDHFELTESEKKRNGKLWCFVSFNKEEPNFTDDMQYLGYEPEICPKTGRDHWQGFVYWKTKHRFEACRRGMRNTYYEKEGYKPIHIKPCNGTFEQNVKYCSKDGVFKEWGEKPSPGARTDLSRIKDEIANGKKVDDIASEHPFYYHQYGRTLNKLEDIYMRKKYRTEMTQGIWIYGPTGSGKSHKALENYTPETHYIVPNDNGWWDGYQQQDIVVLNDFRGEIKYNEILQMVDKWPYHVKRRCREPIPFVSKTVIITSSLHPKDIYRHRNEEDALDQLYRRFEIIGIGPDNMDLD